MFKRHGTRRGLAGASIGLVLLLVITGCQTTSSGGGAAAGLSLAQKREILAQVEAMYPLAKATADGMDLVAAGAVIVLKKDNLVMDKVHLRPTSNAYEGGQIKVSGFFGHMTLLATDGTGIPTTRTFVAGEKFWMTRIKVDNEGVTLFLMSDPYQEQRYHATLMLPYPKDSAPSAYTVLGAISEVIAQDGGQAAAPPPPAPARAARAPAPAPAVAPAPAAASAAAQPVATQTIALGQTREQVVAMLGQPTKIVQLPGKEIDYFPKMKVIFVQGKVSDVQ